MPGKKLYVIIWRGIRGINISTTMREHLEFRAIAEESPFVIKGLRTFDLREWTMMEGSIGLTINCSDRSVELS